VDVLAVTDHNSWWGAVEAATEAERAGLPLRVVIGAEVTTDQGDLIGLFLDDDPRDHSALAFCDAVHEQGGLVLLPHPYRWHRLDDELLSRVDLIEDFNARTQDDANALAVELARERGLPALAGADAHRLAELDLARVEFEGQTPTDDEALKRALLGSPRRYQIGRGSVWNDWLSQAASLMRRPSGRLAWNLARGAVRRVVRPGERVPG
jgi:predicted metal-dependent phosphoesterase TrpH